MLARLCRRGIIGTNENGIAFPSEAWCTTILMTMK